MTHRRRLIALSAALIDAVVSVLLGHALPLVLAIALSVALTLLAWEVTGHRREAE